MFKYIYINYVLVLIKGASVSNKMSETQCKITDLINRSGEISFSVEVTPNIKQEELDNIEYQPLFYSITWHATQHQCQNLEIAPLSVAKSIKNNNKTVLLHLSCNLLKKNYAKDLLYMLKGEGTCNLLVMLGEKYDVNHSDFKSTQDLIRFIRHETGSYFCIGVVGFPDREDKLKHLKEKVDSGADFIITQAVFDVQLFLNFTRKCEASEITVPIIPGIFPFEIERELTGFLNLCKVNVTKDLMEQIKSRSGIEIVGKQITNICRASKFKHFHFFSLDKIDRTSKLIKVLLALNNEQNVR